MKIKLDSNDPASLANAVRGLFTETQAALHGLLDNVPEPFRPQIEKLKQTVDQKLVELAASPTTQVPAANEAAWALRQMCDSMGYMKELFDSSVERFNAILSDLSPKAQALYGLNLKIENGELIELPAVQDKVSKAVNEAVQKERSRSKLVSERRALLATANLPVPTEDTQLEGDDAAFKAVQEAAKNRIDLLQKEGLNTSLNSLELACLAYGSQAEFDRTYKLALKAASRQTNNPTPPDPMLGGGQNKERKLRGF